MKKIILVILITLTVTSCNKPQDVEPTQTYFLSPPQKMYGDYYLASTNRLYITISKHDVVLEGESLTEKYRNFGLAEGYGNTYLINTTYKASQLLNDFVGYKLFLKEDDSTMYFSETKYKGITNIIYRR